MLLIRNCLFMDDVREKYVDECMSLSLCGISKLLLISSVVGIVMSEGLSPIVVMILAKLPV